MSRIDEIKERRKLKYGAIADGVTDVSGLLQASDDVLYLLSKLEIAEKALEFVKGNIEKVFPKFHEEEMRLMVASEKIDNALQQLRS